MADPKPSNVPPPDRSGPPGGSRAAARADTIVFHCPNGHRISVPVKLAGKRGACSKCGTAVVIPAATVAVSPAAGRQAAPGADHAAVAEEPASGDEGTITLKSPVPWVAPAAPLVSVVAPTDVPVAVPNDVPSQPAPRGDDGRHSGTVPFDAQPGMLPLVHGGENATALLVARLWAEREHGGIVELHLLGGSVILPMWYEPRWSLGTHGLFASQAADGTVTLTAVAWESVQKVVVRQVEGLPDGMFE